VRHFRLYLHGSTFTLVTDHQPLAWLMSSQELRGKHARWALVLQEMDFKVEYREGRAQTHVDALSRLLTTEGTVGVPEPQTDVTGEVVEAAWAGELGEETDRGADPWQDPTLLETLRQQGRVNPYTWAEWTLRKRIRGVDVVVPEPKDRKRILEEAHKRLGHYGGSRTHALVRNRAWWPSL
jgi:hypothetical protein